ncbi:hypothetical protein ACFRQM_47515 [Streptomyces sp. NPDC056831]
MVKVGVDQGGELVAGHFHSAGPYETAEALTLFADWEPGAYDRLD